MRGFSSDPGPRLEEASALSLRPRVRRHRGPCPTVVLCCARVSRAQLSTDHSDGCSSRAPRRMLSRWPPSHCPVCCGGSDGSLTCPQRELAVAVGISASAVASAESGARDLPLSVVARIAEVAALRLSLVDRDGREIAGMAENTVRDSAGRRFPAHLDTRYSEDGWWHGPHRYHRTQPWYTFDRRRDLRDRNRERVGTPDDHQLPQPRDSPGQRAEERRRARWAAREEERERRVVGGGGSGPP